MVKKPLSSYDHRIRVQVGDLIRWHDAYYGFGYGYHNEEYSYHMPRYGIVVEIRQLSQEDYEFWLGAKTVQHPYHTDGYAYELFWIKVLTMGASKRGTFIYLDVDDNFEIISKAKHAQDPADD